MKMVYISYNDSYLVDTVCVNVFLCAQVRHDRKRRLQHILFSRMGEVCRPNFNYIWKHIVNEHAIDISLSELWRSKVLWQPGASNRNGCPWQNVRTSTKLHNYLFNFHLWLNNLTFLDRRKSVFSFITSILNQLLLHHWLCLHNSPPTPSLYGLTSTPFEFGIDGLLQNPATGTAVITEYTKVRWRTVKSPHQNVFRGAAK
jgi:hypothetical protein